MTDDESLRDVVSDYGTSKLAEVMEQKYGELLNRATLMGEPLGDLRDVNTGMRQYDHGQASDKTVSEMGVRASFNPDHVDLEDLQKGGKLRGELRQLATQHLTNGVQKLDFHSATDSEFVFWIIANTE